MKISAVEIAGPLLIDIDEQRDSRGFFARGFCREELAAHGVQFDIAQINYSLNLARGTLRGMHLQKMPHPEPKIVRCIAGAMFDVCVDLRPGSPSFKRWVGVELSAQNRRAFYIPPGFAHGFQTLADQTEVLYLMGAPYVPEATSGVRFDDPAFAIRWPLPRASLSPRDAAYPDFSG